MSDNRLQAVEGWMWEIIGPQWDNAFDLFRDFVTNNHSTNVPKGIKTQFGTDLKLWVRNQPVRYRKGIMPADQIKKLESIEGWAWNELESRWKNNFLALKKYAEDNDAIPPRDFHTPDGLNLGAWVKKQRARRDDLSLDRRQKLESVKEWSWQPLEDAWDIGFAHLQTYLSENPSSLPTAKYETPCGFKLGQWVTVQKVKQERMSTRRRKLLEGLDGWQWRTNRSKE